MDAGETGPLEAVYPWSGLATPWERADAQDASSKATCVIYGLDGLLAP